MPALPSVPGTIRSIFEWQVGSDTAAITRSYFGYTGGTPTSAQMNTLATSFNTALNTLATTYGANAVSTRGVILQDIASNTGAQGVSTTTVNGTRGTDFLPGVAAVLVNYSIPRRYRGGKPRSYFPLLVRSDLSTEQLWGSGALTNLTTALNTFFASCVASTAGPISITDHRNVSYYSGYTLGPAQPGGFRKKVLALRAAGPTVDIISSLSVNPKPATQRRRGLHGS